MNSANNSSKIIKIVLGIVLFIGIVPLLTLALWNALLPEIFGITTITYWQALGLLILSKLLFSGFGHFGRTHGNCSWSHNNSNAEKFKEKMKNMSKEEKKAYMKERIFGVCDNSSDNCKE